MNLTELVTAVASVLGVVLVGAMAVIPSVLEAAATWPRLRSRGAAAARPGPAR